MVEKKESAIISNITIHSVFFILVMLCILPIMLVIAISVTDMSAIYQYGYSLFPKVFSTTAYMYIFKDMGQILNSYWVSLNVVVMGSFVSVLLTAMLAYPLSRNDFKYNRIITFIIFFTMLFNGGLVPWYILIVKYLHMKDTFWVLIMPTVVLAWNVILMRTYFKSIPTEIIEAAEVDGCSELRIFLRIVLPMSKPALATIGLLCVLRYWNDWFSALLFIEKDKLIPLQYLLYRIMTNIEDMKRQMMESGVIMLDGQDFPSEPARMAMAIIAAGPMLFIFPFFQKYFVKGLTVGSVKG